MKLFKGLLVLLIIIFASFWAWYQYTYNMDTVIPLHLHDSDADTKVLIASQGSRFKDSLVKGILRHYEQQDTIYFKVIDAYTLFTTKIDTWDAIVIINSWEYIHPPKNIVTFITDHPDKVDKLIILSTVGSSNKALQDIDVISGESIIEKIPYYTEMVIKKLNQILTKT
ncbi:hypothetical protein GCM10022393_10830 [Aquimarina addita]|uniref:DUF4350 domain-containing protein n=1 Tax=Aquimarina addita TaxID=870485 RepID=A0ABP7XD82_9FLAO